jgi:hypothetical protein
MEFTKAHFDIDGQNLRFSVPIQKVDQEHRTVSGFATLDNVDRQGDIVSTVASLDAFNEFRGNLREMHQSIAVGKVLSFSVEDFYDPSTDKVYSGIFVTAYISIGAPDTWEKILDGTLSGFSIGGEIIEADKVFDPETNTFIRMITKYSLIELSVVDSPANQLANIFAVVKADNGSLTLKGMATEVSTSNIFWCSTHQVAVIKEAESANCLDCNKPMENIGWVESGDVDKADVIRNLIKEHTGTADLVKNIGEGGKIMQEEIVETTVATEAEAEVVTKSETVEETAVEAVVETVADATEEVVKAEAVEEVASDESDLVKMITELRSLVEKTVTEKTSENAEALAAIAKSVSDNSAEFTAALTDVIAKQSEMAEVIASLSTALESVAKTVTVIDEADAIKKSGDLGRSTEQVTKSNIWSGAFLVRS